MIAAAVVAVVLAQGAGADAIKAADAAMNAADFQKAFTLLKGIDPTKTPKPELLRAYLLRAECAIALQKPADAEAAFEDALKLEPSVALPAGAAPKVKGAYDKARGRVVGTVKLTTNQAGAMATLDGKTVGPLPVDAVVLAGKHTVKLEAEGAQVKDLDVPAGATVVLSLDVFARAEAPKPVAEVMTPPPPPPPEAPGRPVRTAGFVIGGIGVASLIGSGVMAGLTASSYSSAKSAAASGQAAAFESARSATRTNALVADVLLGVGGAAAGTALILILVGDKPPASATLVPLKDGAALSFGGSF